MIDWQPIETAPPGREILLVNAHRWIRCEYLPKRLPEGQKCYHDDWSTADGDQAYPTHWAEPNYP